MGLTAGRGPAGIGSAAAGQGGDRRGKGQGEGLRLLLRRRRGGGGGGGEGEGAGRRAVPPSGDEGEEALAEAGGADAGAAFVVVVPALHLRPDRPFTPRLASGIRKEDYEDEAVEQIGKG